MSLNKKLIGVDLLALKDSLKISEKAGKKWIYDPIRKKVIILQPEEFVRQLCIQWLIEQFDIHRNNIQVEKLIKINGLSRRFDIVVYSKDIKPSILVECKSPEISITQSTFDQISAYNMALDAPYLCVTNGIGIYCAQMDHQTKSYVFFDSITDWLKDIK